MLMKFLSIIMACGDVYIKNVLEKVWEWKKFLVNFFCCKTFFQDILMYKYNKILYCHIDFLIFLFGATS